MKLRSFITTPQTIKMAQPATKQPKTLAKYDYVHEVPRLTFEQVSSNLFDKVIEIDEEETEVEVIQYCPQVYEVRIGDNAYIVSNFEGLTCDQILAIVDKHKYDSVDECLAEVAIKCQTKTPCAKCADSE